MKKYWFIATVLVCFSLFGVSILSPETSEVMSDIIVKGEIQVDFKEFNVKSRICKIVKGSVISLNDNKLHDIGSGNDSPAVHYVYFNDMKELTNSSLSAWVQSSSDNIYIITNKVWYKQKKMMSRFKLPIYSSQYVLKRGILWEIVSFCAAIGAEKERKQREKELILIEKEYGAFISTNAIANQIIHVNSMTAKAFKAEFRKLILFCRSKCLCRLSNYYNYCYSDKRKTHYSVEIKIDDETFYGYVKKGSFFGKKIFDTLKDGKIHYMTLGISYPLGSDENGGGWAEHVAIVFASESNYDKAFTKEDEIGRTQFAARVQRDRIMDILLDFRKVKELSSSQNYDILLKGYTNGHISKYDFEDIIERIQKKMDMFESGINEYINFFKFNEF